MKIAKKVSQGRGSSRGNRKNCVVHKGNSTELDSIFVKHVSG
jgi:hypothetical protein